MGFLASLIYVILSLTLGSFLIASSFKLIDPGVALTYLKNDIFSNPALHSALLSVGIIITLFCLRYIQTVFSRSKKNKSVAFESPQGSVSITIFAIEDMLKKMLEKRTEIANIKPKVVLRKRWLELNAKGVLVTEVNLVDLIKEIQEKVKEKIQTILGADKKIKVNLEIRKVSSSSSSSSEEELEPKVPFRNYE
ncbi:MAG: alkaline shock response membrane anchor protein AmaP [Candidatus Omnitrophota bacterium]